MSSTKLAFLAVAVLLLLLQASWCAVARQHHDPDPAVWPEDGSGAPAVMAVTSFENDGGGGGGGAGAGVACDGNYYSDGEMTAALSTEWYADGTRCHKKILITSTQTGRTVTAEVVDECNTRSGCDDNMVATSKAVWDALGVDTNIVKVPITWVDA